MQHLALKASKISIFFNISTWTHRTFFKPIKFELRAAPHARGCRSHRRYGGPLTAQMAKGVQMQAQVSCNARPPPPSCSLSYTPAAGAHLQSPTHKAVGAANELKPAWQPGLQVRRKRWGKQWQYKATQCWRCCGMASTGACSPSASCSNASGGGK